MAKIKRTSAPNELIDLRDASNSQIKKILHLNNQFARETSTLDAGQFEDYIEKSFAAVAIAPEVGFVMAFDQDAKVESANFNWFKSRYDRFIYIDRIAVAKANQGQGIGRALYEIITELAEEAEHNLICCEVNVFPENLVSLEFHETLGFEAIEDRETDTGRIVRYLQLEL